MTQACHTSQLLGWISWSPLYDLFYTIPNVEDVEKFKSTLKGSFDHVTYKQALCKADRVS